MYKQIGIVLLVTFCVTKAGLAQVSSSPFTQQGLGDLYATSLPNSFGMAGIGISNSNIRYMNNQNPALLVYNSTYTYTVGVIGESRRASNGEVSQKSVNMNLSHLGMSFPIKRGKWVSSIVLSPYSNVNYEFEDTGVLNEVAFQTFHKGSQGLAQLQWSHGVSITEDLKVGVKAKYLFGSIQKKSSNILTGSGVNKQFMPTIFNKSAVSDMLFGLGVQYRYKIDKENYLNLGVIYDFKSEVKTKRLQTLETRSPLGIVQASDTLINNTRETMTLPAALGFGVSVGKPLKWLASIDVRIQQWSDFQDFNASNMHLQDAISLAIGGEYTPDPGSINKILERMTYRLGMSYEKTPYVVEGRGVDDFGINFGSSIPVGISSLNMGFRFGKRGSLSSHQIKENYFRLKIGLTFNDPLWFIKRKFD